MFKKCTNGWYINKQISVLVLASKVQFWSGYNHTYLNIISHFHVYISSIFSTICVLQLAETEREPWLTEPVGNSSLSKDTPHFIPGQMILLKATGLGGRTVILLQKAASNDPSKTCCCLLISLSQKLQPCHTLCTRSFFPVTAEVMTIRHVRWCHCTNCSLLWHFFTVAFDFILGHKTAAWLKHLHGNNHSDLWLLQWGGRKDAARRTVEERTANRELFTWREEEVLNITWWLYAFVCVYVYGRDNARRGVHKQELMRSPLTPVYGHLEGHYPTYTMVTCQRK